MTDTKDWIIREISEKDNKSIERVLISVMKEFNVPAEGTALSDPELKKMNKAYSKKKSIYYVLEKANKIYGGAGISKLRDTKQNICELQKMYFLKEARGIGLGNKIIKICLERAVEFGYESCYIETMVNMKSAQKLYLSKDFKYLKKPMGNTGHSSCPVWMLKIL